MQDDTRCATTREQDAIIDALTNQWGSTKVLPLRGTDAVLVAGYSDPEFPVGPWSCWWYVPAADAGRCRPEIDGCAPVLRYAYEQEIADAYEQEAVRELLAAARLT